MAVIHTQAAACDVAIIGAGVMGLMTARELALAGCRVTLIERGEVGREASWAGGGIVSPLYPWRYSPAVTALATAAQRAYPLLALSLLEETGIDSELFPCGLLMLDAHDAAHAQAWAAQHSVEMQPKTAVEIAQQYHGVSSQWQHGLWMPQIANIRNPRLLKALIAAVQKLGVQIHTQATVCAWQRDNAHRVSAVSTTDGRCFSAAAFVVCSGAWSAGVAQSAGAPAVAVRPVRGQMLMYRLAAGELPCMVLGRGRYLIPRRDGHVLCGSTLEESGFDQSTTAEARTSLMASAAQLWPALQHKEPVQHWAGLRPAAPEGVPFIGRLPAQDNVWINAGQFRNGLVLAPASARLLADQLLQRPCSIDPAPYQCGVGR